MEYKQPSQVFESVSKIFGRAFYEIASFLKSLSYSAPKLLVSDIEQLLVKTDHNKVFNVATVILNFLLRTSPDIFTLDQDVLEMPLIVANFVSSAFGCDKNETMQLQKMAKDCYSYQLNIIKRLGLPLPLSVKPSDIDFQ